MKIYEISKKVGKTNPEVAEAFGLEAGPTVHLKDVDDAAAEEYVKANSLVVETPVPEEGPVEKNRARFWCINRRNWLPANEKDVRKTIKFSDWVYECDDDSVEAAFLRTTRVRDAIGIREVLAGPYEDNEITVPFIMYLQSLIFTGQSSADGSSREGRDCVLALLDDDLLAVMDKNVRNTPENLCHWVARHVHLNVDAF